MVKYKKGKINPGKSSRKKSFTVRSVPLHATMQPKLNKIKSLNYNHQAYSFKQILSFINNLNLNNDMISFIIKNCKDYTKFPVKTVMFIIYD